MNPIYPKRLNRLLSFIRKNIPVPALILYALAFLSLGILLLAIAIPAFADFFCQTVAAVVRMILAKITGFLPFSLAETVILCLPLILISMVCYVVYLDKQKKDLQLRRFFFTAFAGISTFFTLFVFTFGTGYHGQTLDQKLNLNANTVTPEELREVALYLTDHVNELAIEQDFIYGSFSVMPYSFEEMNEKLNSAFDSAAKEYDFILPYHSRLKPVMLSEAMSYAHLLGMYTYYTGESNINVNFPDYTTPFTAAHEMSHQRGISRENEANFMAFLVCLASDDSYIRYSGYLNLLDYVYDALYTADKNAYQDALSHLNLQTRAELKAYSEFFKTYKDNTVAEVSGTLNDAFLKGNGQVAGTKSYGLVVDLSVAYYKDTVNRTTSP